MRNKQQCELAYVNLAHQPAIIQSCDNGLPGAGGRHDQVPVSVMQNPLGGELLEHLCLEWLRVHL